MGGKDDYKRLQKFTNFAIIIKERLDFSFR